MITNQYLGRNLYIFFLTILFIGTVFIASDLFVDKEIFPQWIVFSGCAMLAGSFAAISTFRKEYKVDVLSLFMFVLFAYLLLRACFSLLIDIKVFYGICFLMLFCFFRLYRKTNIVNIIIIIICVIQTIYGLLQYTQMIPIHSKFPIIGSFDNPAGFAACLAVGFPFCLSLGTSKKTKYIKIITIAVIVVTMVLSESRAGILCLIISTICYYYNDIRNVLGRFSKYVIPVISVSLVVVLCLLFFLKKDSASGRLLIWQVSTNMINDHSLLGSGNGVFQANYMKYQAGFFKDNPESNFTMLADNVQRPFNEYLWLTVEFGLVGLLLTFVIIFITFRYDLRHNSPYLTAFTSILGFANFSYPLRYAFVWLILAYCLAKLSKNTPILFSIKKPLTYILSITTVIFCVVGSYYLIKDIEFEYKWKKTVDASLLGKTKQMIPEYELLMSRWNRNPLFLYNYGAELNHIRDYNKSNNILKQCEIYFNDYDVQMLLADNYFNLEQWENAEKHYQEALYMCPNRFLPLRQMLKIYQETNLKDKAKNIAETIINKPIKIPSPLITRIRLQAKKYLEQNINDK